MLTPKLLCSILIWALEHIQKADNQKAARHARMALEALRTSDDNTDEHAS